MQAAPLPLPADTPSVLSEHRVKSLFAPYGLKADSERLVTSASDVAAAAAKLGFPVVLKVQSPDVMHKTEVGGVKLHLNDAQAVSAAYDAILASTKKHKPDARIEGVLVQKMAPKGHELVVGMVNDPTFGPIMMVGFGGVTVELFGDVVHAPAPLSVTDADRADRPIEIGEAAARLSRRAACRRQARGRADRKTVAKPRSPTRTASRKWSSTRSSCTRTVQASASPMRSWCY